MELRDYQTRAVEQLRRALAGGARRVCVCLPTGAGKSYIAAEVIRLMLGKNANIKVWFCVPRLELLAQMRRALASAGVLCGEISARRKDFLMNVCVCSKDTVMRMSGAPAPDCIFFDEAHIAIEQQRALAERFPRAFVVGLTATPEIADGRPMRLTKTKTRTIGLYDELISTKSIPELQSEGALAALDYKSISEADAAKFGLLDAGALEVGQALDAVIVYGDVAREYEKYGRGKPAIGFAPTIAIADKCVTALNDAGYKWKRISGDMPLKRRQALIEDLTARRVDGLVNAMLLTYGFDAPCVEYAFSVRYVRSRTLWAQMVGRVLRASPGKAKATFVDLTGCCYNFKERGKPFFFADARPQWAFDGKNIVRCQFSMEHICIHKPKRKKPRCVWRADRLCNAPSYWFKTPRCARDNADCFETIKAPKSGEGGERNLEQIACNIVSINMNYQIRRLYRDGRLTKRDATARLLTYADMMGYQPMWVYWFVNKDAVDVDVETLAEIARVKGYKPGWVVYKTQELKERKWTTRTG
jgi:superfamily II DNA or RNA helicase